MKEGLSRFSVVFRGFCFMPQRAMPELHEDQEVLFHRRLVLSSNCRGQGLTFEFLDSQFGHTGAKSTGIESQYSCSSFVTLDSPARVFEYPDNVFLFHFFESLI